MKARSQGKEFVVVTKVPKLYWRIPRLDEKARLQELGQEEEASQRLGEGTTPQGRELLRKLLFGCEMGVREGKSIRDMAVEIQPQLLEFAMLRKEWSLLISRLWGVGFDQLLEARPYFFAVIVATIAAGNIDRKKRRDAPLGRGPYSSTAEGQRFRPTFASVLDRGSELPRGHGGIRGRTSGG